MQHCLRDLGNSTANSIPPSVLDQIRPAARSRAKNSEGSRIGMP